VLQSGQEPDLPVTCVHGIAGLTRFAAEIDRLNAAAPRPNPFLSSAFLKAYCMQCEYYVPDDGERLYLVWEGPRLIGCVPMRRVSDGSRFRMARMLGWRSVRLCLMAPLDTELPGVLAATADQERVAKALIRHLCEREPGWDMLELAGQQPDGSLFRAVHAAGRWRFRAHDMAVEPYNDIEVVWADLHAYFRSLAKKMRSNISRQARRLFAAGEVELILVAGAEATSAWFDAYCDLDRRSWKNGTAASIRRDPQRARFYQEIAGGNGGMDPSFVGIVLDGVLIAGLMLGSTCSGFPRSSGAWCLEMAYDESRAELGPAQLLLLLAVKFAIEGGHAHLSFMQNFSHFKHRWGAQPIEVWNVRLIRRATLRNLMIRVREFAHRGQRAQQPDSSPSPDDSAAPGIGISGARPALQVQQRARALTALALAATKHPARLDAAAARDCLPFPLE
jgi:hypothetical protein